MAYMGRHSKHLLKGGRKKASKDEGKEEKKEERIKGVRTSSGWLQKVS